MSDNGIMQVTSKYSFAETVDRLLGAFSEKGLTIFATIDQQAQAQAVGLEMQPSTLIIFGSPKAGSPLMIQQPSVGLDLPLKVIINEIEGTVQVRCNTAAYIAKRHNLPEELAANIAPAQGLIKKVVSE